MKINYNISAMIANNALKTSDSALTTSLERLSSGYKINHAKDNASGLAMAKRMNAQIRSLEVADQNANDGISVIEIAEGALIEIEEMVQRMSELSVKACNATMGDEERAMIDQEINNLRDEIERIADTTMYNGQVLLDGTFDLKGYTSENDLKVVSYSDEVRTGEYTFTAMNIVYDPATKDIDAAASSLTVGPEFPVGTTYYFERDSIFLEGPGNFKAEYKVNASINATDVVTDFTGLGAMGLQVGAGEGQELATRISTIDLRSMGIDMERYNCSTEDKAHEFLGQMNKALEYINEARSRLGAYQNRLEHTINSLDVTQDNMTGAYSRIMDVDMAQEMTEYSKNQVLVQAGTSMLAQANERPAQVLQLLQS